MSNDKSGSAFPIFPNMPSKANGMTLRDYFATSVMNALISRGDWESDNDPKFYATWSYEMADAMLEARK